MPYVRRRKAIRRRRPIIRRRRTVYRRRYSRVPRPLARRGMTSMVTYSRWQPTQIINSQLTGGYKFYGLSFQLSDLNSTDLANYTNLFDSYRYNAVTIAMRMLSNPSAYSNIGSTVGPTSANFYVDAFFTSDKTDSATPTTLEQVLQYGKTVKACTLRPSKWVYYHFYPKQQMLVFSGLASGYATPTRRNNFIACDNGSVPHYGLKYCFGFPGSGSSDFYIEQKFRYNITFRGSR